MGHASLLISGFALLVYALLSRRLGEGVVTGPMIFLGLGLALNLSGLTPAHGVEASLHILAEATLVIVLFADASMVDVRALRRRLAWPERMLAIGLPLTMAFGFLAGLLLFPGWPYWELALLAAILAPTDAALGQAVVANKDVPAPVREALTVESGVNDGLALPAVLMFACLAVEGAHDNDQANWLLFTLQQIGLGAVAGAFVGGCGAAAQRWASHNGFTTEAAKGIAVLALAGLSYLAAAAVGGNGFLAAFIGGLAYGAVLKEHRGYVFEFMESEGQLLILCTFLLLGASVAPHALSHVEPVWIVAALFSLFVARPLAIWISLWRSGAPPLAKIFMGWFGPRGLATALFALLVLDGFAKLQHGDEILSIAILTVLMSAALHGVTAAPGARWYARNADINNAPARADGRGEQL